MLKIKFSDLFMESELRLPMEEKFYKIKKMEEFSRKEWELICDRCGLCCLEKLIDDETEEIFYTRVACEFLDVDTCRCGVYEKRFEKKCECIDLNLEVLKKIDYLPDSCSYRVLYETGDLPQWHHLVCGDENQVHENYISARDFAVSGRDIKPEDLEDYI